MIKRMDLCWITVSDLAKAEHFFVSILGMELKEKNLALGWLEIGGTEGGALLGVAQTQGIVSKEKPGHNAIVTLDVDDLVQTKKLLEAKGVHFFSDIIDIPGEVKLAFFKDEDGNTFQLVEEV